MNPVFGQDAAVAEWMFQIAKQRPMHFEMAVGLVDHGVLVGGIMFTNWNGSDIEVHYYGPGKLKRPVVRLIFMLAAKQFNVNRMTIRTRKESMARGVEKLGAVYEGTVRRLYGPTNEDRHAGRQFAFYRETIDKLAGIGE